MLSNHICCQSSIAVTYMRALQQLHATFTGTRPKPYITLQLLKESLYLKKGSSVIIYPLFSYLYTTPFSACIPN